MMKKRPLGKSGLNVSVLCFGGNVFGWTVDQEKSFDLLDAYVEAGGNFIDTADVYSRWVPGNQGGESETILGNWMKARKNRDQLIIATKVGMEMSPKEKGLSKEYIIQAVEASLKRLQTDYIDLYLSHTPDASTPIEETLETYAQLEKQGKIRSIGASNYSGQGLRDALDMSQKKQLPRYESLQPLYNLYDRASFENDLQSVCEGFDIGVTPYSSLASGFLTGKYRSEDDFGLSPRGARMAAYLDEKGKRILKSLDQVSEKYQVSQTSIALAWLMSQTTITSVIASATSLGQLKEVVASTQIELDPDALELLKHASDPRP